MHPLIVTVCVLLLVCIWTVEASNDTTVVLPIPTGDVWKMCAGTTHGREVRMVLNGTKPLKDFSHTDGVVEIRKDQSTICAAVGKVSMIPSHEKISMSGFNFVGEADCVREFFDADVADKSLRMYGIYGSGFNPTAERPSITLTTFKNTALNNTIASSVRCDSEWTSKDAEEDEKKRRSHKRDKRRGWRRKGRSWGSHKDDDKDNEHAIAATVVACVLFVILLVVLGVLAYMCKKKKDHQDNNEPVVVNAVQHQAHTPVEGVIVEEGDHQPACKVNPFNPTVVDDLSQK